ncbi:hypothetical protein L9O85_03210 [Lawsonibacter asaccharolyticus]|uniref:hypothetical protein n=2 Tax=Clostridia TaxID=186801 RepID=UPI000D28C7EC|nr:MULTISPECIES: hypothetical protein [Eubacteriales]MBS5506931.1 hypothetical protein [Oscillospiraceae bacterium]UMM47444.1 hypothetical protein L9O85_03210 [Lawsonibacter asaccharolyticus]GBF67824.1 hypothetical protein LAWASA_502 [Lawsonibacter asaccharolyticus]
MKRTISLLLACALSFSLAACGGGGGTQGGGSSAGTSAGSSAPAGSEPQPQPSADLTPTQQIIQEAQGMTLEELAQKAIEESNGKTFLGVGNSSRGKSALPLFIEYLQSIDPSYTMEFEWQQPKNNKIFDQLTADSLKDTGTFAMTLIQDGNQIESKMVQTGILDTFIPKDWAEANGTTPEEYQGYLPLQTLNKIFMYNNTGSKSYDNCWDFVAEGEHGLFMDIDSEIVGKNFLYMLTRDDYAAMLKEAFDALSAEEQAYFQPTINEMASEAESLGLGENGKYALAWIKLWVGSYNAQTDDGPICNTLVDQSATDQFGLIVYSKLRSVEESASVSKNNITVAAYNDGYTGMGGFGYCHYLFVTDNSPLPWTACAFIAYMTCTADGFSAWGKDIGGYSSNPEVAAENEAIYHHETGGMAEDGTTVEYAALNDHGYDWWTNEGKLVLEDPEYCASVSFTVGSWIEMLDKYSAG